MASSTTKASKQVQWAEAYRKALRELSTKQMSPNEFELFMSRLETTKREIFLA